MRGPRVRIASAKWVPKCWRPEYEAIVLLSSTGMSRDAVIEKIYEMSGTRYTPQHITNILTTPEAIKIQSSHALALRENFQDKLSQRLTNISEKGLERIESLVNDDKHFERAPFAVVDRAMAFMKMTRSSIVQETESSQVSIKNAIVMTKEAAQILQDGASKADEVARLYAGDIKEIERKKEVA